ncbi:MAG: TIGR04282 family arsenosugar biosynthesis glycosyltransferase [Candidatus Bathyarchaeota archaeon]
MKVNIGAVLLVKYPEKGKVKTRLLQKLEVDSVVELYRNFVLDMISMLDISGIPYIIGYCPKIALKRFEKWLGFGYTYVPQRGKSMGQMLQNIFIDTYSLGFRRVMVIASDCPDLPNEILQEASEALESHNAVIGPSPDGGYYLIGFTQEAFSSKTLEAVTWSTEKVFKETISNLKDQKQSVHILPEWSDVDNLADLKDLFKMNQYSKFNSSKTMRMLHVKSRLWFRSEVNNK